VKAGEVQILKMPFILKTQISNTLQNHKDQDIQNNFAIFTDMESSSEFSE
jgi:hypothetical protein